MPCQYSPCCTFSRADPPQGYIFIQYRNPLPFSFYHSLNPFCLHQPLACSFHFHQRCPHLLSSLTSAPPSINITRSFSGSLLASPSTLPYPYLPTFPLAVPTSHTPSPAYLPLSLSLAAFASPWLFPLPLSPPTPCQHELTFSLFPSLHPSEACLIKRRAMCQRGKERTNAIWRTRLNFAGPPPLLLLFCLLPLPLPLAWAIHNYPAH